MADALDYAIRFDDLGEYDKRHAYNLFTSESPNEIDSDFLFREVVRRKLRTLTPREENQCRQLFGIGCKERTAAEIAANEGITVQRLWQIVNKAKRKLRHDKRLGLYARLYLPKLCPPEIPPAKEPVRIVYEPAIVFKPEYVWHVGAKVVEDGNGWNVVDSRGWYLTKSGGFTQNKKYAACFYNKDGAQLYQDTALSNLRSKLLANGWEVR